MTMSKEGWDRIFGGDPAGIEMLGTIKKRVDERTKEEREISQLHELVREGKEIPEELKKYVSKD